MVIGATTIGRELRDKQLDQWISFSNDNHYSSNKSSNASNIDRLPTKQNAKIAAESQTTKSFVSVRVPILVLLSALIGKYSWPMLAFVLWSALAVGLASYQQDIDLPSLLTVFLGLVLLMILSFWLGAIFTLVPLSLRMGLSSTGFISAPSYAFAGVTYPYIAISDNAQYWANALPLTHYLKLHIAQLQMQAPLLLSLPIIYGLTIAIIVATVISTLLTKRALAHPERWGAR